MSKMTSKKILTIFTLCILIVLPMIKELSFYLVKLKVITDYDSINPAIVLFISIPFLMYIYISDIKRSKRKIDIFDILFYILIFTGIISTIFAINKQVSFFGKEYRHEGFLSVLSYYLLFINWKVNGTKEDIKKLIKLVVFIAIVNSIYALFQIYTKFNFILRYSKDAKMAYGLCVNPNFFGSLIVTVISMVSCIFLMNKKIDFKTIIIIILLFISLINSQSTGPFLTYIIALIFLFYFLYLKKKIILKNILILICILLFTYTSIYFINKNVINYSEDNINYGEDNRCELCDINKTIKSGGNGRLTIWKNSLNASKKYLITGTGYDNLIYIYPNPKLDTSVSFTIENGVIDESDEKVYYEIVDNAHNVYLHILISNGILNLIPYLILCLITFIIGLKSKESIIFILLSGFVAYSIQAFANISVIEVAPIYYIIIGLILSSSTSKSLT